MMKKITKTTILKQGDIVYQPVESDGIIYWVDKPLDEDGCIVPKSIVALTAPKFTGIPIISLDSYVETLAESYANELPKPYNYGINSDKKRGFITGYKTNSNQYTQADIEKAIELAREQKDTGYGTLAQGYIDMVNVYSQAQIMEQLNSISVIEVDEQFNILSYE